MGSNRPIQKIMKKYYAIYKTKDFQSQRYYGDSLSALIMMIRNMAEAKDNVSCEWNIYLTESNNMVAAGGRRKHRRFKAL